MSKDYATTLLKKELKLLQIELDVVQDKHYVKAMVLKKIESVKNMLDEVQQR